ncbi:MAG TPA: STAS domain-containing protein [Pyrinomonadaceae bacterium]|nr:STAS domain-containing protein [Pyrinomonadaceae bacterium]
MNYLNITQRQFQNVTIFDLEGKIFIGESIVNFRQAIRNLSEENKKRILLNMTKITHIDSSGLGELVGGHLDSQKNGGEFKLLGLSGQVIELMKMTRLLTVFETFEDETDALNSFQIQQATLVTK